MRNFVFRWHTMDALARDVDANSRSILNKVVEDIVKVCNAAFGLPNLDHDIYMSRISGKWDEARERFKSTCSPSSVHS